MILLMTFFQERKKIISHLFVIRILGIIRKSLWALMEMWFPIETIYEWNWGMIPRKKIFTNHVRKFETSNTDKNHA